MTWLAVVRPIGYRRRSDAEGGETPTFSHGCLTRSVRSLCVSSVERSGEESDLHLFAVDDPRLWKFRSRLDAGEFAIPDVSDAEWDRFHAIIAEA